MDEQERNHWDRLARSTKDTISIAENLDKRGADLVSLSEKIDTTTAAGKIVFRMLTVKTGHFVFAKVGLDGISSTYLGSSLA